MWQRSVLVLMTTALVFNGAHMLFAPEHWYYSIGSVPHTGPFNAHFVRDIGSAYLACAVGLGLAAWRPRWLVPAALPALTFLAIHAGIHGWEALFVHTEAAAHAGWTDAAGVYAPPLLVLLLIVYARKATADQEV